MTRNRALGVLALAAACSADASEVDSLGGQHGPQTGDTSAAVTTASGDGTGQLLDAGHPGTPCSLEATESIQLLDIDGAIHRLWPETLEVEPLGRPDCEGAVLGMALTMDRGGTLWAVMVTVDGPHAIYTIDPATLECETVGFMPPAVPHFFMSGVAFVADEAGAMTESLYVAADMGDPTEPPVPPTVGRVDLATMTMEIVGAPGPPPALESGIADLSGSGDGRLFGLFAGSAPVLAELGTHDGAFVRPAVLPFEVPPSRWAFAQWAGRFWLFTSADEAGANVVAFDPVDGSHEPLGGIGVKVVGAAVSTCAPYVPQG